MTLPEQSNRAIAQTREFLVRLASPYGENGIKGIRREVRDEASRLLRHYPYAWSDEKRGVDDTSGATDIVTRLRNWRTVHLARLHILMDEAADEMERLSEYCDCLVEVNAAKQDTLTDAEREAVTTAMNDYAEDNADEECAKIEATLRGLLERMR
jgi:hypothetical protein